MNYNARFIQLAGEINSDMPRYWVEKALRLCSGYMQDALNGAGKSVKGSRVLVLGVAYKKDVNDVRESPSLDMIKLSRQKGANVRYHDPCVPAIHHNGFAVTGESDLNEALAAADCVVVVTDHACYDWTTVAQLARCAVDTRSVLPT